MIGIMDTKENRYFLADIDHKIILINGRRRNISKTAMPNGVCIDWDHTLIKGKTKV